MTRRNPVFEHRYFSSYPVESEGEALWLSKEPTFAILKILWEGGPKGLTPSQVIEKLSESKLRVGRSVVYQTLKALKEREIVEREWDNEIGTRRNILRARWLPAIEDEDFAGWIEENLSEDIEKTLFPAFLKFLENTMERARTKNIPLDFMPKQSKEAWCHNCDLSHEAQYFFLGLLYDAACSFVFSPEEWKFKNEDLGKAITNLYVANKLASSELGRDE
jgi:DNA-binding transcriptional ArsR family regulator